MARRPRTTKKAATDDADLLLSAAKLAATLYDEKSTQNAHRHARLQGRFMTATNGFVAYGCPVQEDVAAAPNTAQLLRALERVQGHVTIAQLDGSRLIVKGERFRATVDCAPLDTIPPILPDEPVGIITPAVLDALAAVVPLTVDKHQKLYCSAVLLANGSAVATNGICLAQAWHGVDMPPGLLIPKASVTAILRYPAPLTVFGYGKGSLTLYTESGAWVKVQLYVDEYVTFDHLFEVQPGWTPEAIPEGLTDGVEAVAPFCDTGRVIIRNGLTASDNEKATHTVDGAPDAGTFDAAQITAVLKRATHWDYATARESRVLFQGNNYRALLAAIRSKHAI